MKKVISSMFVAATLLCSTCHADVSLIELMYNPSTSQGSDSTHEYLVLSNTTGSAINLEDYVIADAVGTYNVPAGVSIAAMGFLVMGSDLSQMDFETAFGMLPSATVYFDTMGGLPAFNNGGDDISMTNPIGTFKFQFSYPDNSPGDGDGMAIAFDSGGNATPIEPLSSIPEPGSSALLLLALGTLLRRRRR